MSSGPVGFPWQRMGGTHMIRTFVAAALGVAALGASPALADIKIGTAGPLSNAEALFGNTWQNGMQLAINEANAAGGVNGQKLVLVRQDDQGDPKQGTLLAQKFCDDDGVLAVIANFNSGVTIRRVAEGALTPPPSQNRT